MSDPIKHECGLAFIRLRKPLEYYQEKYGSALYGLRKLQLLMAKQLNRGQDGAGIGVVKLNPEYGRRYLARKRSNARNAVADIFEEIMEGYKSLDQSKVRDTEWLKQNFPYAGELLLGHLRYGTHGGNSLENIHPFLRQNNWMSRNLVLAGNYNVTNLDEMFGLLIALGQQPKEKSDNVTMLEKIGHFLDEENSRLLHQLRQTEQDNRVIAERIKEELDIESILLNAFRHIDGGYNMCGMIGDGNAFIIRDPWGIRPSYYYVDDEIFVSASERPAIMTALNVDLGDIRELGPGNAMIIRRSGEMQEVQIRIPGERRSCSFERIYFSRGSDANIHKERKELGRHLCADILNKLEHEVKDVVFTYVPNTAATAFYGLIDGLHRYLDTYKFNEIQKLKEMSPEALKAILDVRIRREKILVKDVKMRTFITQDEDREDMVGHVYDVTYGVSEPNDTIVVVDDSIVRGTTLKSSILRILDRLGPKKIIVASSAPIIKYPDCYGIDMSRMNEFIAFRAALSLLKKSGQEYRLKEVYDACREQVAKPDHEVRNAVQDLYANFSDEELSREIALLVTPKDMKAEVEIVFQSVDNLHQACPKHLGDWYFTGDYPTPGGMRVANRSFIYYMEGKKSRAY